MGGSGGSFEKVYLELTRMRLTVLRDRSSSEPPMATLPLSGLLQPVEIVAGAPGLRCFEVILSGAEVILESTWIFRCVSGRRAEQWVEAINRAQRSVGASTTGSRTPQGVPSQINTPYKMLSRTPATPSVRTGVSSSTSMQGPLDSGHHGYMSRTRS